jgi:hypothetical protein
MNWHTLERCFKQSTSKDAVKVRFNDWNHRIKYFTITGESSDGKRFVGTLDNGEKISFPKRSRGWSLYHHDDEFQARAV